MAQSKTKIVASFPTKSNFETCQVYINLHNPNWIGVDNRQEIIAHAKISRKYRVAPYRLSK